MPPRQTDARRQSIAGKRRTRAHILTDLSVNYVERQAPLCGYSTERVTHDYGTDLLLFTYDTRGAIENGHILLQLKATDTPGMVADGSAIRVAIDRRDLLHWLNEPWPVIPIVYDGCADRAYWVYVQVQAHFASAPAPTGDDRAPDPRRIAVRVPVTSVVDPAAIREFAKYRDEVLARIRELIGHDA